MNPFVARALGVAVGVGSSLLLFPPFTVSPVLASIAPQVFGPNAVLADVVQGMQYSGTILSDDANAQTFTLLVQSSFPTSDQPAVPVTFRYDSDTRWYSAEYAFRGGIVETKRIATVAPRELPHGTLMTLVRDPDAAVPFRATIVVYLRKTEL